MEATDAKPLERPSDVSAAALESIRFLLLGGTAPPIAGVNLETDAGAQFAAIILTKRTTPAELLDTLSQAPDPAVPIADFSGSHPLRSDYVGSKYDAESVTEMKKQFAPIWRRLEKIPFRAKREDRDPLTLLRLVYSRNTPAKAQFAPDDPLIVQYPLLGTAVGTRRELEALATMGLLDRRHFTRTHACSKCGSARLNVYEACPGCHGADLAEEALVHHYRCGCQETESHFAQGLLLICPKCRRELRHLGVDYGKPGNIVVCRTCGAENSEPLVHFVCLDCSAVTPSDRAAATDWYDYDLTDAGMGALREGRLPRIELGPQAEHGTHAYSLGEFQLLATQEIGVARQYSRPFSVARVTIPNIDAVRRDLGPVVTDAAFQLAVDKIVETVRPSDFVGIDSGNSVVIAFPETPVTDLGLIEQQIRQAVHDAVAPFELAFDFAEGNEAINVFAKR
jgi:hypothetical protein